MEQIYVFGTGNAQATRCYNTCFALKNNDEYFMIDAGGGNGILKILEDMCVPLNRIHHLFVTHEHTDHILGVVWMIRMIGTAMKKGNYEGNLNIYCHEELVETIKTLCKLTLQKKFYDLIGSRIDLITVANQDQKRILGYEITFFDILSTKAKQFGFTTTLENGKHLVFAGDEPLDPGCNGLLNGCHILLHEAFCLYEDRERFQPYEKHHSTVREACLLAQEYQIPELLLWHTEDKTGIASRKERYISEGSAFYHGSLLVPDEGEIINL